MTSMAGFTNGTWGFFLTKFVGGTANFPETVYCGLSTGDPGYGTGGEYSDALVYSASSANEPTGGVGGYGRVLVSTGIFTEAALISSNPTKGAVISNAGIISFTSSSAAYSSGSTPITHVFFSVGVTTQVDDIFGSIALTTPIVVDAAGIEPRFQQGSLILERA